MATRISPKIRKVAILGGGPSGAVSAKCLLAEGLIPTIFEQRSTFGGVWNYTPETKTKLEQVPLEDPTVEDDPVPAESPESSAPPVFMSPVYAALETNIPKEMMTFKNWSFDEDLQLFPKHGDVSKYVQAYSSELTPWTKFNHRIVGLVKGSGPVWAVKSQDVVSQQVEESIFDAVIIATGHYIVPYIPPVDGMKEFEARYPGSIRHSKYFRTTEGYEGKRVVVVGNAASGIDIAMQIAEVCEPPLYQSCKSPDGFKAFPYINPEKIKVVQTISQFKSESRSVVFHDGTVFENVDVILYCT
ncbi:hypothetical protein ABW19_dt0201632 [Dactylella cylindrospora]|nr:hypothetical protein ABW19_dt0201632 [Dactylella cylindrospora]